MYILNVIYNNGNGDSCSFTYLLKNTAMFVEHKVSHIHYNDRFMKLRIYPLEYLFYHSLLT